MSGRRGSILILALWSITVFAVFAVSLGAVARQKITLGSRLEASERLYAIAFCGIERARAEVLNDAPDDLDAAADVWGNVKSSFSEIQAGGGTFTVGYAAAGTDGKPDPRFGAEDEERKVNLNKAEPAVIQRVLESAGVGRDAAEDLSQCIVDWRDGDSAFQHAQYGAEDAYYDDLPLPYACKDAPLESLDELLLIKGMKRDIFDKIKPYVTVWGSGSVNINTAYPQTLEALGLDRRTVEKIIAYRAGADQKDGTGDDVVFPQAQAIVQMLDRAVPPLDAGERAAVSNLILGEKLGTISSYFSAKSRGKAAGPAWMEIEAVMDRAGKVHYSRSSGVQWPSKG
jgi:general secretion pathway protein K